MSAEEGLGQQQIYKRTGYSLLQSVMPWGLENELLAETEILSAQVFYNIIAVELA